MHWQHQFLYCVQVDFRQSVDQNRFVVKPGVDPQLDESKLTVHASLTMYRISPNISRTLFSFYAKLQGHKVGATYNRARQTTYY